MATYNELLLRHDANKRLIDFHRLVVQDGFVGGSARVSSRLSSKANSSFWCQNDYERAFLDKYGFG